MDNITTGFDCSLITDAAEFNALSIADQQLWLTVCGWDFVDFNNGIALATAQGLWSGAAGTITRPNLVALSKKNVRRALQVVSQATLSVGHVTTARLLP